MRTKFDERPLLPCGVGRTPSDAPCIRPDSVGTQILFESHSEHLLRRLQRRIAEQRIREEDVSLLFCSVDQRGTSAISHLELDRFGNISNWPNDFFGDLFGEIAAMSKAALKREGNSD